MVKLRIKKLRGKNYFLIYKIIFSIGSTNMPSAPNEFSLPMISQKCFSAMTDWTDTQFPSASGVMVGLFEPEYVRRLIDEHVGMRIDHSRPLWTLLVFMIWHEEWQRMRAAVERAPAPSLAPARTPSAASLRP